MIREVDLNSYLPPYLKGYKEIAETLKAEDPEFKLLWEAVDRLLKNQFIEDADEYGISRREDIIGILPSSQDTLESRRSRVQALWWNPTPYSIRAFVAKIADLCGENGYEVDKTRLEEYWLGLTTHLSRYGQVDNLKQLILGMPPCNIVIEAVNDIVTLVCAAIVYAGTVVTVGNHQHLDNDVHDEEDIYINPKALVASVGEVYENCEGNFGRDTPVTLPEQLISSGFGVGTDDHCVLSEGGNRDESMTTKEPYIATAVLCAATVTLTM